MLCGFRRKLGRVVLISAILPMILAGSVALGIPRAGERPAGVGERLGEGRPGERPVEAGRGRASGVRNAETRSGEEVGGTGGLTPEARGGRGEESRARVAAPRSVTSRDQGADPQPNGNRGPGAGDTDLLREMSSEGQLPPSLPRHDSARREAAPDRQEGSGNGGVRPEARRPADAPAETAEARTARARDQRVEEAVAAARRHGGAGAEAELREIAAGNGAEKPTTVNALRAIDGAPAEVVPPEAKRGLAEGELVVAKLTEGEVSLFQRGVASENGCLRAKEGERADAEPAQNLGRAGSLMARSLRARTAEILRMALPERIRTIGEALVEAFRRVFGESKRKVCERLGIIADPRNCKYVNQRLVEAGCGG